jgi:aerobic carbon-monoxide dehydrogenase small subunit
MPLALIVNGRAVSATVEPRMHLADFLRERQNLTGTHLGCEHGVCGACTVLINGEPARSCITYAVVCEGATITTIEGLDDDEIVRELRAAFSREHALQCGYCTPGMLVSARDLVLRAQSPSEQQIRVAMSGNLCRCTGYVGIVRAIASTVAARRARGITAVAVARPLGPVGSGSAAAAGEPAPETARARRELANDRSEMPHPALRDFEPATSFDQNFVVQHPVDQVWAFFGRLPEVVACLPGATLTGQPAEGQGLGRMRIRVGPLAADFHGVAEFERDDATHSGIIRGSGRDTRSTSATRGSIRYRLVAIGERAARVELTIGYTLTGPLAQFSRTDLVQDIAGRLIQTFVNRLEARLSGQTASAPGELHADGLIFSVLVQRLREWVSRLFGRGRGRRGGPH